MLVVKLLVTIKLKTGASFRAVNKIIVILNLTFKLSAKNPSNETISIWVKKIGYYNLVREKEKADDWIIILDENIKIGREKLLVIFGIRQSKIDNLNRPLKFTDLTPITEIAKPSWRGELIEQELLKIKQKLGTIIYAVGDYGGNLKKSLILSKIKHVHDITHKVALIIESLYAEDKEYLEFTKLMSKAKCKLRQTEFAPYEPPRQRNKARFQNISSITSVPLKIK